MKLSQSLRRLQWRARRMFQKPADNDPLVAFEPAKTDAAPAHAAPSAPRASAAAPARRSLGGVLARAFWLSVAFLVTLAVLAAAYIWFVARESRVLVEVDPPTVAGAVTTGSAAVRAAADLIGETVQPTDALADQALLLAPTTRRVREAWLNDGAAASVGRFLDLLQPLRGRSDLALSEARFALAEGGAGREAARAALLQFNDRVARGVAVVDQSERGFEVIVTGAARAVAAEAEAIQAAANQGRLRPIESAAERTFFLARGAALAWRRVLTGYVQDAPARLKDDRRVRLAPAFAALDAAAGYQPTLLANAPLASSFAPNHLAALGMKLGIAALRLEAAARPV